MAVTGILSNAFSKKPKEHHLLFLKWLSFTGAVLFIAIVFWDQGLLKSLYASDISYISFLITILYFVASTICAVQTFLVSRELNETREIDEILHQEENLRLVYNEKISGLKTESGKNLPKCLLSDYIRDLLRSKTHTGNEPPALAKENHLFDAYIDQLRNRHDIGWFMADVMLKLGLLGTVIGFIMMLSSVAGISSFEPSMMQEVLINMSGGMRVALFTTLSGLIGSILVTIQFRMLDGGTENLHVQMVKIIEVEVASALSRKPGKGN